MTDTRVYGNQRRTIWSALDSGNPFADPTAPTATEINAMLNISSVIKWTSTTLAMQASAKLDDRVLTDSAGAKRRGFLTFAGTVNLLSPKNELDTTDPAQQAYTLFKTPHEVMWIVDRIGPLSSTLATAGERVNVYKIAVDAKKSLTSGDNSYSYTIDLIPQGDAFPGQVVAGSPALAITTSGHEVTLNLATKVYTWGQAELGTSNITTQATWTSDNPAVAVVDSRGLVTALSAGTTNITASYPGATASTPIAITVTAA